MEYAISYHIMTWVIFVGIVVTTPELKTEFHCPDNLPLTLGRTNFIDCKIPTHYQSIFWYSPDEGLMTSFSNGEKGGNGYKSGHFDILADGTLVIYNTGIDDLGTYYVGVTYSDHVVQYASVLKTHNGTYESDGFDCISPQFLRIGRAGFIHCNIPPGFLSIFWSHSLDDIQSSTAFIDNGEKGGNAYNSGHFDILENGALVINNVAVDDEGLYQVDVIDRTASVRRAQIIIHATGKSFSTLNEIAHSYYIENHRQRYSKAELMFDDHTGDIKVRDVTQRDHGTIYMCFSNVNGREAATAYSIFVIVPPSPPYIRIVGCRDTVSSCQKRGREGKIVCKVSNVFPNVTLQPSTSTPPDRVKFTNIIQKEDKNGDNYDITLVFNYTVGSTFCNVDVPITCIAVGEPALTFPSQRDVFVKENCVTSAIWSEVAITERSDVQPSTMSSLKITAKLTMNITCLVTVLFITYV
ncbi:hypothetical protein BSL78_16483 [Apostichopus japonicus]|uniref:Immunoglobulin domain-containing protein n=1 Tax=Stichopus japonicus TaxID=307972 RepID=A0A2G8KFA5_STIJA|nr:hypothetical protein BSL78_16483 [Apostichopus japonicus]